jgi:hypothetical protein
MCDIRCIHLLSLAGCVLLATGAAQAETPPRQLPGPVLELRSAPPQAFTGRAEVQVLEAPPMRFSGRYDARRLELQAVLESGGCLQEVFLQNADGVRLDARRKPARRLPFSIGVGVGIGGGARRTAQAPSAQTPQPQSQSVPNQSIPQRPPSHTPPSASPPDASMSPPASSPVPAATSGSVRGAGVSFGIPIPLPRRAGCVRKLLLDFDLASQPTAVFGAWDVVVVLEPPSAADMPVVVRYGLLLQDGRIHGPVEP